MAYLTLALFVKIEDRKQNTEDRIKDDTRLCGQIPGGKLLVAGNNIKNQNVNSEIVEAHRAGRRILSWRVETRVIIAEVPAIHSRIQSTGQ